MKLSDLDMKCGVCPIIELCNDYADTPPCHQPRLEDLSVQQFLDVVDYIENRSIWDEEDDC